MKKILGIFFTFFILINISSQTNLCNYIFKGKVIDGQTNQSIKNATILLKSENANNYPEVISDSLGNFLLDSVCAGNYRILVSSNNYNSKEVELNISDNIFLDLDLLKLSELSDVIVIGKKQLKNTQTSVENKLSKDKINAYSDTNLGTLLSTIAGVNTLSTGNNVVKPVIHGMHSSRVPVMNNGIKQEDQQWGIEHAPDIDLNVANSISIIKGAGALQYSGDAVGGLVLIEPKKLTAQDTLLGNLLGSYISNGRGGNISANIEKGWGNGLSMRLQGTYKNLGDLSAPHYNLSNTGVKENDFSFQLGYNKQKYGIEAFYSYYGLESGILKSAHIGNLTNLVNAINSREPSIIEKYTRKISAPKQKIEHNLAKINTFYRSTLGVFNLAYAFQYNKRQEFDIRRSEFKEKPSLDLELSTQNVNFDFDHNYWGNLKGKMGISYIFQENKPQAGTGVDPLIPYYKKNSFGIYWLESYELTNKLTLEGGVRYDYQKINALKFYKKARWRALGYDNKYSSLIKDDVGLSYLVNPKFNFNGYSATLGFNYKINHANQFTFNYSLSSRAPNPSELFSDGLHHSAAAIELGDLELGNEKSSKWIASFKSKLLNSKLDLELVLHYNTIKDFINEIPVGAEYTIRGAFPVWKYIQTNAEIYGMDITADYRFTNNWNLSSNFSYLRGQDTQNHIALINMPPTKWVNSIEYINNNWNNFFVKLSSISVFKQNHYPDYNFNVDIVENGQIIPTLLDLSSPPSAYQLFDFTTGLAFNVTDKNQIQLSLIIRNIFDTSYRNYMNRLRYYSDETGRNIILQMQYNF
ncbi:TonB-dependent receptor [Apibacter muscae]|uniref:TonB-dependent receptor n=1 Tax=Apibacter muscae TaxID=2509004 RepID=UPI0011AC953B|nr:TonB-dependent receptor [Apibacter muscae]TWP29604.1 TonB-dependent receptor [Apibacter muscae]